MRRRLRHASALFHPCRSSKRLGFSLYGQEAQLKTFGRFRLLSVVLVLLHLGFLWVSQSLHTTTASPQAPLTRLAPTVLVLLPPSATPSTTRSLPDKKRPLEPARAGNSVPQYIALPSAAETDQAVTKLTSSTSPVAQIIPASPGPQAPNAPSQAARSAVPIAPAAPEPPRLLNLALSREAMRAFRRTRQPVAGLDLQALNDEGRACDLF